MVETRLDIGGHDPSDEVLADAKEIADKTIVEVVRVEDAVDSTWFIRVEGPTGDFGDVYELSEREFKDMAETVREVITGNYNEFKTYHGVGEKNDRYLIRIEY